MLVLPTGEHTVRAVTSLAVDIEDILQAIEAVQDIMSRHQRDRYWRRNPQRVIRIFNYKNCEPTEGDDALAVRLISALA